MIITVTNRKGGVAKTTTSQNMGFWLARSGKKTLFIDLDAQSNLTLITGASAKGKKSSDVLLDPSCVKEAIEKIADNLWIIPSGEELSTVGEILSTKVGKEYRLREALSRIKGDYDYIIIDTPPALDFLTINAFTATDRIVIPAKADTLSLYALHELSSILETVRKYTNPDFIISGILYVEYNPRTILTKDLTKIMEDTCKTLGTKLFNSKIRASVIIKEAQAKKSDIFSYAPDSKIAKDYEYFMEEFLNG